MADIRVEIDHSALRDIERSPETERMLLAKAQRIARAHPGFKASSMIGRNRARASVITATFAAREAEAKDHALLRAIDLGRG